MKDIKEAIIEVTTELIESSNGNIDAITTRAIAEKAGVGVGLINYHFQTKDNLIEICVQRIIENVVKEFSPVLDTELSNIDKLRATAKMVMDFLWENPSVSRISILGDYSFPKNVDNTMKTISGFLSIINGIDIEEKQKKLMTFGLTSILQALFLRRNISSECVGFDLNIKSERDMLVDFYVDNIFGGEKL